MTYHEHPPHRTKAVGVGTYNKGDSEMSENTVRVKYEVWYHILMRRWCVGRNGIWIKSFIDQQSAVDFCYNLNLEMK